MVNLVRRAHGRLWARMSGGGFGGCTVNLVRAEMAGAFAQQVANGYQKRLGITPEVYICRPAKVLVSCQQGSELLHLH